METEGVVDWVAVTEVETVTDEEAVPEIDGVVDWEPVTEVEAVTESEGVVD